MTPRCWSRSRARRRVDGLFIQGEVYSQRLSKTFRASPHEDLPDAPPEESRINLTNHLLFSTLLLQAGIKGIPLNLYLLTISVLVVILVLAILILGPWGSLALPLGFAPAAIVVRQKRRKRAANFAADYPTFLLAAASSLKAGRTVFDAFFRATRLLPDSSITRQEISSLLNDLNAGIPREKALLKFGRSIALPDIELFRQACLLALEHGGSFSAVLQRLARVTSDRATLINAAKVSTASMRLTANIILFLTPTFIGLVAIRTENFFSLLTSNSMAGTIMSVGLGIVLLGYLILREMSEFTP